MIDVQYAYLLGALAFGVLFWLPIYILRPDLRRELVLMSLLTAPLGPITTFFFLQDYWSPVFVLGHWLPIEDVLFAFFIGGFGGTVYEVVFGKKTSRPLVRHKRLWGMAAFPLGIGWMYAAYALGITSIYAATALLVLLGFVLILFRPDLRYAAYVSATLTAAGMFVMYQLLLAAYPNLIDEWWHLHNLSLVFVVGVPIEELLWGASWGFFAGPVFEFVAGSRYIQRYGSSAHTDRAVV